MTFCQKIYLFVGIVKVIGFMVLVFIVLIGFLFRCFESVVNGVYYLILEVTSLLRVLFYGLKKSYI